MAKTKHVRLISPEQGLTTYCSITFIPSDPDIPSSYLDAVDMKFRVTPTTAYHDLTESTTVPGTYKLSDSTIEWPDGFFKFDFWSQLGGTKAPTTDDILTVTQNRIKITDDTIYATFQTTDVKNIVEQAASDIIAALGTVVNSSFEGTATDGTNTTIEDTTAAWDTDIWASTEDIETLAIVESAATGTKYVVKITSNTADTLTVDALAAGYVVVAGDTYTIIRNSSAVDIKSVGATAQTGIDLGVQIPLINTKLDTVNTNQGTIETDIEAMTATTPTIYNISIAIAGTEYSQALPANTKRFSLSIIDGTPGENFRWAYETGKVATPTAPYRQLDQSFEYECDKINSSATIYVAASDVCTAQLEVWS
jgi:hypothetical protein